MRNTDLLPGDLVSHEGRCAEVRSVAPNGLVCTATLVGKTPMTHYLKASAYRDLPATDENLVGAGFRKDGEWNVPVDVNKKRYVLDPHRKGGKEVVLTVSRDDVSDQVVVRHGDRIVTFNDSSTGKERRVCGIRIIQHLMRLAGHDGKLKLFDNSR